MTLVDVNFIILLILVASIFRLRLGSLENAGEGSALPMLKSVRLALGILASGKSSLDGFSGVDTQVL